MRSPLQVPRTSSLSFELPAITAIAAIATTAAAATTTAAAATTSATAAATTATATAATTESAAATAAAAATESAAATTLTTRAPFFGFVNAKCSAVQVLAIHAFDGLARLIFRAHGHETKPTRLPRHAVARNVCIDDFTEFAEH